MSIGGIISGLFPSAINGKNAQSNAECSGSGFKGCRCNNQENRGADCQSPLDGRGDECPENCVHTDGSEERISTKMASDTSSKGQGRGSTPRMGRKMKMEGWIDGYISAKGDTKDGSDEAANCSRAPNRFLGR